MYTKEILEALGFEKDSGITYNDYKWKTYIVNIHANSLELLSDTAHAKKNYRLSFFEDLKNIYYIKEADEKIEKLVSELTLPCPLSGINEKILGEHQNVCSIALYANGTTALWGDSKDIEALTEICQLDLKKKLKVLFNTTPTKQHIQDFIATSDHLLDADSILLLDTQELAATYFEKLGLITSTTHLDSQQKNTLLKFIPTNFNAYSIKQSTDDNIHIASIEHLDDQDTENGDDLTDNFDARDEPPVFSDYLFVRSIAAGSSVMKDAIINMVPNAVKDDSKLNGLPSDTSSDSVLPSTDFDDSIFQDARPGISLNLMDNSKTQHFIVDSRTGSSSVVAPMVTVTSLDGQAPEIKLAYVKSEATRNRDLQLSLTTAWVEKGELHVLPGGTNSPIKDHHSNWRNIEIRSSDLRIVSQGASITIYHKNGCIETLEEVGVQSATTRANLTGSHVKPETLENIAKLQYEKGTSQNAFSVRYLLTKMSNPGGALHFEWHSWDHDADDSVGGHHCLAKIKDDAGNTCLEFDSQTLHKPSFMVAYPGTIYEIKYDFIYENISATSGNNTYYQYSIGGNRCASALKRKDFDFRLTTIRCTTHLAFPYERIFHYDSSNDIDSVKTMLYPALYTKNEKGEKEITGEAVYRTESVTRSNAKIATHSVSYSNNTAPSTSTTYTYHQVSEDAKKKLLDGSKTRMVTPKKATEEYYDKQGFLYRTITASNENTLSKPLKIVSSTTQVDEKQGILTVVTTQAVASTEIKSLTAKYDFYGNLISLQDGNLLTEWTYYLDFSDFDVKSKTTVEHATSLKPDEFEARIWALRALENAGPAPIIINKLMQTFGSRGLSWGKVKNTEVHIKPAKQTWMKATCNLPVALEYPGDEHYFSGHVASKLISYVDGNKKHEKSISYYGYKTIDSMIVPTHTLTISNPLIIRTTAQSQIYEAAKDAASDFLSLDKPADDPSKNTELSDTIKSFKSTILAQSQQAGCSRCFKLKSWKNSSMTLETLAYHESGVGKGNLKSKNTVTLNADGQEVAESKIETTLSYTHYLGAEREKHPSTLITYTDVKTTESTLRSTQERDGPTGQLVLSLSTTGLLTSYTYTLSGLLSRKQVFKNDNVVPKKAYSYSDLAKPENLIESTQYSYYSLDNSAIFETVVKDELTEKALRWFTDPVGRLLELSEYSDAQNPKSLLSISYDAEGRLSKSTSNEYTGDFKLHSSLVSEWSYSGNTCTLSLDLKNPAGKSIDSKSHSIKHSDSGQLFSRGVYSHSLSYEPRSRLLTQTINQLSGTDETVVCVDAFDPNGVLTSAKTISNKIYNELTFGYDPTNQLIKLDSSSAGTLNYSYDDWGRRIKKSMNRLTITNSYSHSNMSTVPTAISIQNGDSPAIQLGTQSIDALGRPKESRAKGFVRKFKYNGASENSIGSSKASSPVTPAYSSFSDTATQTHTESYGQKSSVSQFTTRGLLANFKDIAENITSYTYDAYNRVTNTNNTSCNYLLTYHDSGLLKTEVVQDLVSGVSITTHYKYDALGNEVNRHFLGSDGLDVSIERVLLDDGRVSEISISSNGILHTHEEYEYDDNGHLTDWLYDSKTPLLHNNKAVSGFSLTHDALGNVTEVIFQHTDASESKVQYLYDPDQPGRLEKAGDTLIHNSFTGRMRQRGNTRITYYRSGQVKTYGKHQFIYDDRGRVRGSKTRYMSDIYHYRQGVIYAKEQICTQAKETAGEASFTHRQITLLNDSPSCLLQQIITENFPATVTTHSFELRDAAGSVIASYDPVTKEIRHKRYTPYGYHDQDRASTSWLGFKGEPIHAMGLYYLGNGYRLFDPEHLRFQIPDSWSPFGAGGLAAYVYGSADPVNHHDPSGHMKVAHYHRTLGTPVGTTKAFKIAWRVADVVLAAASGGKTLQLRLIASSIAAASSSLDIASILLEESDEELSAMLGKFSTLVGACGTLRDLRLANINFNHASLPGKITSTSLQSGGTTGIGPRLLSAVRRVGNTLPTSDFHGLRLPVSASTMHRLQQSHRLSKIASHINTTSGGEFFSCLPIAYDRITERLFNADGTKRIYEHSPWVDEYEGRIGFDSPSTPDFSCRSGLSGGDEILTDSYTIKAFLMKRHLE